MVVEDDDDTRMGLQAILRSHGYEVAVAGSGRKALMLAAELQPDVVVLDLGLPDAVEFSVLRDLNAAIPDARIIVFSARDGMQYESEALAAGATLYLEKPADGVRVAAAIDGVMN